MTIDLYTKDSYLKETDAIIEEIREQEGKTFVIILDKTIFYPDSGGQPNDTGFLEKDGKKFTVLYVKKNGKDIFHEVEKSSLKKDDSVRCVIDWNRRYLFMRYHTASHVLSGIINKHTGALITGNQISAEKTRIDFNLENFDKEKVKEWEEETNKIIKEGHQVKIKFIPREEADESVFRLAAGLPESIKILRIVEIVGFDQQACGGTHVKNTSEIVGITVQKIENKGKNNRRIYFKLK